MLPLHRRAFAAIAFAAFMAPLALPAPASARDDSVKAQQLAEDSRRALDRLIAANPGARALSEAAIAEAVFPAIVKAGLVVGGAVGDGTLFRGGEAVGYYRSVAASVGLQAGAQKFGYALFIMNDKALRYMNESAGWEIGVGPSVVLVDEGFGARASSTTLTQDVYAIIFDQTGLMAGLGLEGSKITRITP